MSKDWLGNTRTTFATLGASSHSATEREKNDYYATDPDTVEPLIDYLVENEMIDAVKSYTVWECACGEGHLSKKLEQLGFDVRSSDLIDRGYGEIGIDFLLTDTSRATEIIITNPPYKYAQEFVEHAIKKADVVCMFLKLTFLEGQKRKALFTKHPPEKVLVFSARQKCAINGDFENTDSSAACYAWFVWRKDFRGSPTIAWL